MFGVYVMCSGPCKYGRSKC